MPARGVIQGHAQRPDTRPIEDPAETSNTTLAKPRASTNARMGGVRLARWWRARRVGWRRGRGRWRSAVVSAGSRGGMSGRARSSRWRSGGAAFSSGRCWMMAWKLPSESPGGLRVLVGFDRRLHEGDCDRRGAWCASRLNRLGQVIGLKRLSAAACGKSSSRVRLPKLGFVRRIVGFDRRFRGFVRRSPGSFAGFRGRLLRYTLHNDRL